VPKERETHTRIRKGVAPLHIRALCLGKRVCLGYWRETLVVMEKTEWSKGCRERMLSKSGHNEQGLNSVKVLPPADRLLQFWECSSVARFSLVSSSLGEGMFER
jgi:hypothetical protein